NEENARAKLLETKPKTVFNQVGRAYGILINAHIISSKEAKNLLSLVRLGVDLGYFPDVDAAVIDELFIVTEPAHIQYREAKAKSPEERDIMRSNLLRERLSNIPRPVMTAPDIPEKTCDPKEDDVNDQEE
ncbi:MAG TPA: ATP--guanido phosphotransferase, partial [Verrucomicrobiales bacterium]|nr:ATP--guanido phosphotransferase [Verrucomicrobiales bacterium]